MPAVSEVAEALDVQPVLMRRIGFVSAAVVVITFGITALVMKHANAGAHFGVKDQISTALIGVILGGLLLMLTRPRMRADRDGVRLRAFLGGWRTVPWDVIVTIEFPAKVRFARLVLPGEETLAIYAIQRMDKQHAVDAMRNLRTLFAEVRPPA